MNVTEQTIDELIAATFTQYTDPRQKHFFRESLRNLVRLAKAEQMQAMRMDINKITLPHVEKVSL